MIPLTTKFNLSKQRTQIPSEGLHLDSPSKEEEILCKSTKPIDSPCAQAQGILTSHLRVNDHKHIFQSPECISNCKIGEGDRSVVSFVHELELFDYLVIH